MLQVAFKHVDLFSPRFLKDIFWKIVFLTEKIDIAYCCYLIDNHYILLIVLVESRDPASYKLLAKVLANVPVLLKVDEVAIDKVTELCYTAHVGINDAKLSTADIGVDEDS